MGSCFNCLTLKDDSSTARRWNDAVDCSLEEDGNSYSGGIGMLGKGYSLSNRHFDSQDDAIEFMEDNHSKFDDGAIACRFTKGGGLSKSSGNKQKRLEDAYKTAHENIATLHKSIRNAFKNRKSKLVTCAKCDSKLNKDYVRDMECPLCTHSFISPTDLKRIGVAHDKSNTAHRTWTHYKPAQVKSGTTKYIVIGGWCRE